MDEYSNFESNLQKIFDDVTKEYNLDKGTLTYERSFSAKGGIASCGIFINEMEYPPEDSNVLLSKTIVARHDPIKDNRLVFKVKPNQYSAIDLPSSAIPIDRADISFKYVSFDIDDDSLISYLEQNIRYCLDNYVPQEVWGCCSRYKECSAAKKCLHPKFLFAKRCQYRQNLEKGKIFY